MHINRCTRPKGRAAAWAVTFGIAPAVGAAAGKVEVPHRIRSSSLTE